MAKRSLEAAIQCGVRSKGRAYLKKDGTSVKRLVCQYSNMKGWKRCDFSGTILRRPDGRYTVEIQAGIHGPHLRDGTSLPTRTAQVPQHILRQIDEFVDCNAKPSRIERVLRKRGVLEGIENPRKCINNRLYQTRNRLHAADSRPPPGASRADIARYCTEKSSIPDDPNEAFCIHYSYDPKWGLEIHLSTPYLLETYATAPI
ncbi:hypothetical protein FOZ63_027436, partial [Perkinsus olseni]